MMQFLLNIDQNILLLIQDFLRSPVLNQFFIVITSLGNSGMIWIIISIILLISAKTRRVGAMTIVALILVSLIINTFLKNFIGRIRPYEVIPELQLLVDKAKDYSFPSGHTSSSVAVAYIMYKELPKRYSIPAIILACLIAFSRLYIGIHYPSDVLGGAVMGILIALVTMKLFEVIRNGRLQKREG